MNKLYDETYLSEDNSRASRNIWYGYIELYKDAKYGKEIILDESLIDRVSKAIQENLLEGSKPSPTETNWYFYGETITSDAIEDKIRPSIMVREKDGIFIVHCNISDNDFAVNIEKILSFQADLEKYLASKCGLTKLSL